LRGFPGRDGVDAMTLVPARARFERDPVTSLTSRVLVIPADGGDGLQLIPVRDDAGLLVDADVGIYRRAA
jgi:hypothetical protein